MSGLLAPSILALLSGAVALDIDLARGRLPVVAAACAGLDSVVPGGFAPCWVVDWTPAPPPALAIAPPTLAVGSAPQPIAPAVLRARQLRCARLGGRTGP